MSATLAATRRKVRLLMRDTNQQDYAIGSDSLDTIILRHALEVGGDTGLGEAWSTVATLSDTGSTDFAASLSSQQLARLHQLRIASTGGIITRVSDGYMENLREATTIAVGEPVYFVQIEGTTQGVTLRFWPRPTEAYTVEGLITLEPSQALADTTVLPLSDMQLRIVELSSAAEGLASLVEEELAKIGMSQSVVPLWERSAERLRKEEKWRRATQKRQGHLPPRVV